MSYGQRETHESLASDGSIETHGCDASDECYETQRMRASELNSETQGGDCDKIKKGEYRDGKEQV